VRGRSDALMHDIGYSVLFYQIIDRAMQYQAQLAGYYVQGMCKEHDRVQKGC